MRKKQKYIIRLSDETAQRWRAILRKHYHCKAGLPRLMWRAVAERICQIQEETERRS